MSEQKQAADLFGGQLKAEAAGGAGSGKSPQAAARALTAAHAAAAERVSVIVPVPGVESYTYALPAGAPSLSPGAPVQVPLGGRQVAGIVCAAPPANVAAKKLRFVDKIYDCPPLKPELMRFLRFVADYTLAPIGLVARMTLAVPGALNPLPPLEALRFTGRSPEKLTPARQKLLDLLGKQPVWPRAALAKAAGVSAAAVDGLKKLGCLEPAHLPPAPVAPPPQADYAPPQLSEAQARAAGGLCMAVEADEFSATLLEGVTGSGKTEVYFEAIAAALRRGRQVLVMLPEIALTGQMLRRFAARFGAPPAVWHSELTPQKREKTWRQVMEGQIRIIAGARSALFLPYENLGLIIVDEEHDSSYKQEDHVFYNARDMAVARASIIGIPIILASATPSLESLVNVLQRRYRHVVLPGRYGGSALPQISAVDMRQTPPPGGRFLAPPLAEAISATLAKGEQSLLFLNRRGYAPLTLCRKCGFHFSCPHCSAWLVEHKSAAIAGFSCAGGEAAGAGAASGQKGAELVCHHCEYHRPVPQACPECGAQESLAPVGPGVERIAEEAAKLWPQARQLVLSADTAQSVQQMRAELEAVARGGADILIGTQLVAKGHHFPKLTFVGVVDADIGLSNGDLRAGERCFQLLAQVTGRAGRELAGARGLIQTYQPQHPALQALIRGDGQSFIRREIEERAACHLPPFGQLAALIISAPEREEAENYARILRRLAPEAAGFTVLGPAEAPLARLRNRWRFRLLVQANSRRLNLQAFLRAWRAAAPAPKAAIRVQTDIDPQSFF